MKSGRRGEVGEVLPYQLHFAGDALDPTSIKSLVNNICLFSCKMSFSLIFNHSILKVADMVSGFCCKENF